MARGGQRRWVAVLAAAASLGLTGVGATARPAEAADWQGCYSDTRGNWARGYCYPWVDTSNLGLFVKCKGDKQAAVAPFDRETYMSMPRGGMMRVKAAAYDCGKRKVVWHEVRPWA
jgi:hypothetical protein